MFTLEPIIEIRSGLYKIELPLPIRPTGVQVYFFHNSRHSVLIDTGLDTEESLEALSDALREIRCTPADISTTICTHYHPDHYGASLAIKKLSGCDVLMHKADSEYLFRSLLINSAEYRNFLISNGIPVNEGDLAPPALRVLRDYYNPVVPDKYIEDGEHLTFGEFQLQAILTPGHTPGHIVLYWHDKRLLVSGDHLLPNITPHVGIHLGTERTPLANYLDSLRVLEKLEVEHVLPAHGPCFGDHRGRIHDIFSHHHQRQRAIVNALKEGPVTAYELALKLFEKSLPALHKEIAAYEVLAHLELMERAGSVNAQRNNGVVRYSV